jgi:predicted amidohydrolase YtcJ
MPAQILLKRVNLFPLGQVPRGADALLIQDGRIAAMGREVELAGCLFPKGRIIDVGGRVVLPGFIDTHVHLVETGLLAQEVDLSPAETISQVLDLLAKAFPLQRNPSILQAHSLDPSQLEERRYPRMGELDAISSEVPIFVLRRDGHSCVINSAFYGLSGLTDQVPGVEMDATRARPTGTLRAGALELARKCRNKRSDGEDRGKAMRQACWEVARRGATTVHALFSREKDVDVLLQLAGELPVDVVPYLITVDVDLVQRRGLRQIGGDLMVDGSLGSHTAALFDPYADCPGQRGRLYFHQTQLTEFVARAHRAGLQVAMHAIGDRAVEQLLMAYETVLDGDPREDHRHRIEHAELLTCGQIQRIAQRGVALAVQPAFETFWGGSEGMYARRLGRKRAAMTNPYRSLIDAGVIIAGGSDSFVTPVNPLAGIAACVNRPQDHRLSVLEAVRVFTSNGAWLGFEEKDKGQLKEGLRADLVILSADPRSVPVTDIQDIKIHMVFKEGEVIVEAESTGADRAISPKKK